MRMYGQMVSVLTSEVAATQVTLYLINSVLVPLCSYMEIPNVLNIKPISGNAHGHVHAMMCMTSPYWSIGRLGHSSLYVSMLLMFCSYVLYGHCRCCSTVTVIVAWWHSSRYQTSSSS